MCEYDTDDKIREAENMTEKQKEMSYWGWKFENYVLSEKEDENPNITDPVNNNLSFVSVVRSRLENHSIGKKNYFFHNILLILTLNFIT